ncbi:MAG: PucR family transcriptional regulator [Eubacteriaceae bacterium]
MKITVPMILDKLENYEYEYLSNAKNAVHNITNTRLLKNNINEYHDNIIYIINGDDWIESEFAAPSNLIVVSTSNINFLNVKNDNNTILIKSQENIFCIIEKIQDIISYYNYWADLLLKSLSEDKDLKYIVDTMQKFIKNPISVVDSNFKLLELSKFEVIKDGEKENIKEKYPDDHYIFDMCTNNQFKNFVNKMNNSIKPVYFEKKEDMVMANLCTNITIKRTKIGYFAIFEAHVPITQGIIDICEFLSTILSIHLQKNELIRYNEGIKYEYFLKDLLDGKSVERHEVNNILSFLNISVKNNLYIFNVRPIEFNNNYMELSYVRMKLMQLMQCDFSIIYKNNIVFLHEKKDISKDVVEFLKSVKMSAGISECFYNLKDIKKYFMQTLRTLEIGYKLKRDEIIYNYNDYQIYHMLSLCDELGDIEEFCHSSLLKLIEYDKNKHTDFTQTLYKYIICGRSQKEAATELFLHRSSLLYRINKIEEIMQVDLNDYKSFFHIQLSFELLKYKGVFNY